MMEKKTYFIKKYLKDHAIEIIVGYIIMIIASFLLAYFIHADLLLILIGGVIIKLIMDIRDIIKYIRNHTK